MSDKLTAFGSLFLILMVVFVLVQVQRDVDNDFIYPMPLHPGVNVILHDAGYAQLYSFRFINANKPVSLFIGAPNTDCRARVGDLADLTEGVKFTLTASDASYLHKDFCATVQAGEWPMVYECWPASGMAGAWKSCRRMP